jgi:hypothetical protein
VHPQVGENKEGMEEMIAVVKENSENNPPASKKRGISSRQDLFFVNHATAGFMPFCMG